jgi:hypothetical protein
VIPAVGGKHHGASPPVSTLGIDTTLLEQFERDLDPRNPGNGPVPVRMLGYGEISTVIAIDTPATRHLAFKRMPMFTSDAETATYESLHREYVGLLEERVGLRVVPSRTVCLGRHGGMIVVYIVQQQVEPDCVAQRLIPAMSVHSLCALARSALTEVRKVRDFNAKHEGEIEVAVDGQLSNWSLRNGDDAAALERGEIVPLDYLDTSTPLVRRDGREQLDTELFLRSAPAPLRPALRAFVVRDVVDRYYDHRSVAIDMAANCFKEQRPDAVPRLVDTINTFLADSTPRTTPISVTEVSDYYRSDARIWRLYLGARRTDRWLRRLLGRPYPYILPPHIER